MPCAFSRAAGAALIAVAIASACGGDDGTSPSQTIEIAVSSSELTVGCGRTGSLTATVTRGGGFAGTVTVTVAGLPDDVTATLSPDVIPGSATTTIITILADDSAQPGSYPITVTATSDAGEATDTYMLVLVEPPDFSIRFTTAADTVPRDFTASLYISITRTGGFSGEITFSLLNPPPGISATFMGSSIELAVDKSTPLGTYTLTVAATSPGIPTRTATMTLTVIPEYFLLSANPSSPTIARGASATVAIGIERSAGFTDAVALWLQNPPDGVTVGFDPNVTTGASSTMTITVGSSVAPGTYTLTVLGQTGFYARQATISLTVIDAPGVS